MSFLNLLFSSSYEEPCRDFRNGHFMPYYNSHFVWATPMSKDSVTRLPVQLVNTIPKIGITDSPEPWRRGNVPLRNPTSHGT